MAFLSSLLVFGFGAGVEGFEIATGAVDVVIEFGAAEEELFVFFEFSSFSLTAEPLADAVVGDGGGEGFVEGGFAFAEELAVGEFVEDEFGEGEFVFVDEGVEERVAEPAEGGVGIDSADDDIVALSFEFVGFGLGVFFFEVAAIFECSDDGVGPLLGFEAEFGGGEDVPDDVVAFEVGVGWVGGAGFEVEFVFSEGEKLFAENEL